MLGSRQIILEVMEQFPPDPSDVPEHDSTTAQPHDFWRWSQRMVPFAEDVSGDNLFVDLRDGPAYVSVGLWIHDDNRTAAEWPSLTALLEQIAHVLETRSRWEWSTPIVVEGRLDWD